MFELLITIFFIGLLVKGIGLVLRLSWGLTKIAAGILMVLSLPVLILFLIFAGGLLLLIPIAMVAAAVGMIKLCA